MAADSLTSGCTVVDLVIILDESTSIVYAQGGYDNWYVHMIGFVQGIVKYFKISPTTTRIGVLKFSEGTTVGFYLDRYSDATTTLDAVGKLDINGGETNIAAALRVTRTEMYSSAHGARPQARRVAVLLTDGEANREQSQTASQADLCKAAGIEIFTIGITNRIKVAELQYIASQPLASHYYTVNDYSGLGAILGALSNGVCSSVRNNSP
jgi:hypothetical protein